MSTIRGQDDWDPAEVITTILAHPGEKPDP